MPNWCEGTLKVRGKVKDLKQFVLEGLEPVDFFGNSKGKLQFDKYGECTCEHSCYIENTRRGFVEGLHIYIDSDYAEDDINVICMGCKFAWGISAEELQKTCKKYNVDMKIFAFERGMQFNQNIEIVDGQIIKDEELTFDNYDWECICPNMGG